MLRIPQYIGCCSPDEPGALPEAEGATYYAPPPAGERGPDRRKGQGGYSGPERRQAERRSVPPPAQIKPEYGKRQAPVGKLDRKLTKIESSNKYGLKSSSEMNYPAAYAAVSREMWEQMSEEQRAQVLRTQAIAQEKVGFEKGAPKFFIADFDPSNPNAPAIAPGGRASAPAASEVELAAPRLIVGGMLIGAGGLTAILALIHVLMPLGMMLGAGLVALVVGVMLAINPRS